MNIAVVGSREYPELDRVTNLISKIPDHHTIITGDARGVDQRAIEAAKLFGMEYKSYEAKWEETIDDPGAVVKTRRDGTKYNVLAGHWRNTKVAKNCDRMVAFWDGQSSGTIDAVKKGERFGKDPVIFLPSGIKLVPEDL